MLREFAGLVKRSSAVAGVAMLVAFAGQANAVSYVGSYDPPFLTTFSGDSWSGQVRFEVPDACIPSGDGIVKRADCGGLKFLGATVEMRDAYDALLDTLVFPASYFGWSTLQQVRFDDGLPDGVNGTFWAPVFTEKVVADDGVSGTLFWLSFENFLPKLTWAYQKCEAFKFACKGFGETPTTGEGKGVPKWDPFYVVPEPGSLALLLSALAGLGLVRSRKNRAAPAPLT